MKLLVSILLFILFQGCQNQLTTTEQFNRWLKESGNINALDVQPFVSRPLTEDEASEAVHVVHTYLDGKLREEFSEQWEERVLIRGEYKMPFEIKKFGIMPSDGWSVYISLHGGGNTTQSENDKQWQNQIELYQPKEGIYLVPRAPENTWDMWHKPYVDSLLNLLIQLTSVFEEVNTNKVYLTGYSAGGDGTYQLAPRMADRLAAAAMIAGHPNDASPVSLRNLPFAIQVGAGDVAYNRTGIAHEWEQILDDLQANDPDGYVHDVKIYKGLGHWLEQRDTTALNWMSQFSRNPYPQKINWDQNGKEHLRFYWLALPEEEKDYDAVILISRYGQVINIDELRNTDRLYIYLNDEMLNLDRNVVVNYNGDVLYDDIPVRTISSIWETMFTRNDLQQVFSARIEVSLN